MADMRIGGLASGMDIDTMVKDLMKVERLPLQKLEQEKQILEWKREDYRSLNTLLLDFRSELTQMNLTTNYRARSVSSTDESKVTATASSAASLSSYTISNVTQLATAATLTNEGKLSDPNAEKIDVTKGIFTQKDNFLGDSNWKQGIVETKNVTATSDNPVITLDTVIDHDTAAISVKVDGKAYKVVTDPTATVGENEVRVTTDTETGNNVLTFADGVLKKDAKIKIEYIAENKTETKTIDEPVERWQLAKGSIVADDNFSLSINDTNYKLDLSSANGTEYNIYSDDADQTVIGTLNTANGMITFNENVNEDLITEGTEIKATYQQNYTDFSLGAHTSQGETYENFIIAGNESMNAIMSEVNGSNVGVTMFYDSFSDRMTLTRNETGNFNGDDAQTSYDPDTGVPVGDREIITNGAFINNMLQFGNGKESGGDNVKFEINGLETERNANTFDISGVTFSIKKTFEGESATMSVNNDSDQVFENIKEFVETYNTLIGEINKKLNEEFYRDYKPLTDDEREELSDKQQEKWEEMARSGLLRRDPALSSALSSMRMDFYTPVSNGNVSSDYNQLASIGITTTKNYLDGGKLEINEAKLRAAIEDDPQSVENLFRGNGDNHGEKGITRRLYDTVNGTMDKLYEKAGRASYSNQQFTIGRQLEDVEDQISRFEDRLTQIENRYWRQFTAMEKAIMQSNNQMNYLYQQFSM